MDSFLKKLDKIKKEELNTLFIITKSTNTNILNYIKVDNEKIIQPIWWMYKKKGIPKEELTFLEKTVAYGISKDNSKNNDFFFHLIGYSKIKLKLTNRDNIFRVLYNDNILLGLNININDNLLQNVSGINIYSIDKNNNIVNNFIKNN